MSELPVSETLIRIKNYWYQFYSWLNITSTSIAKLLCSRRNLRLQELMFVFADLATVPSFSAADSAPRPRRAASKPLPPSRLRWPRCSEWNQILMLLSQSNIWDLWGWLRKMSLTSCSSSESRSLSRDLERFLSFFLRRFFGRPSAALECLWRQQGFKRAVCF